MELIALALDFILHVDRYLEAFVRDHGTWVYVLLFVIIFVETGVVVMPFLPGDSLLFVVGAMCGLGLMSYPLSVGLLFAAATMGNQSNYMIGHYFGPKVFQWEQSRFFNKRAFNEAHAFYERYGGITIVLARFMPFLRTFAPFVAGVAQMTRSKFTLYDVGGGALWVGSIITAGYFFGNIGFVRAHLDKIIWAMILLPGLIVLFGTFYTLGLAQIFVAHPTEAMPPRIDRTKIDKGKIGVQCRNILNRRVGHQIRPRVCCFRYRTGVAICDSDRHVSVDDRNAFEWVRDAAAVRQDVHHVAERGRILYRRHERKDKMEDAPGGFAVLLVDASGRRESEPHPLAWRGL